MAFRVYCLLVSVTIFAFLVSTGDSLRYRIIAGRKATALEFPYQVDIERMTVHWCGGSIIHEFYVLTAAHCIKAYQDLQPVPPYILRVRVGNDKSESGGYLYNIEEIIPHESYSDSAEMDQYDIALLKLQKPIEFNSRVKPVSLASGPPQAGSMGWVTGFGRQEIMRSNDQSRQLMAVYLPLVSLEECSKILPNVANDMICAGYKKGNRDSCTGDSGGPFVVDDELTGIVAWGVGCGREGLPGVYTNVYMYLDWIDANTIPNLERATSRSEVAASN